MNQREALAETIKLAMIAGMDQVSSDNPDLDFPHLWDMYQRVINEPEAFSEAKLGRWLGWIQCAVVAADVGLTLEDMKDINTRFAD